MKVFVTTWCLTVGIKEVEGQPHQLGYFSTRDLNSLVKKNDWFESMEDAQKDAEGKKAKKIEQLQNQIKKLQKLSFIE